MTTWIGPNGELLEVQDDLNASVFTVVVPEDYVEASGEALEERAAVLHALRVEGEEAAKLAAEEAEEALIQKVLERLRSE